MKVVSCNALHLARRDITEENIWITRRELPDGRGQKMSDKKTVILCGISGVEENPLFPEEILRHLSGLMYWMKIRGLNNQIHIINSIMRRKSVI